MDTVRRELMVHLSLHLLFVSGTEKYVGEAIRESGIPREDIFVITKLPSVTVYSVHCMSSLRSSQ